MLRSHSVNVGAGFAPGPRHLSARPSPHAMPGPVDWLLHHLCPPLSLALENHGVPAPSLCPPLHPSCHRCGSKLPFRSSTPWVWASGVSSPLPPTTHFTRTSIGQCSLLDPGGLSGEEKGWPGRASRGEARPAHLACTWTSPGRDTFIVTLGNAITSILAGFAIFSVLGYMSQELGVPVDQVAKAGRQAAGPWWVRVCVGSAGPGQESPFVDQQSCEWDVECVCACMNVT